MRITYWPFGENTYVKSLWFELVNSGTSGKLTPPSQGTVVPDQWAAGVGALASQVALGEPNFVSPVTSGGVIITATIDLVGNWTLSGTPSSYPVAVVYVYKTLFINYDSDYSLGGTEIIPTAMGVNTDASVFSKNLSSADTTVQHALATLDGLTVAGGVTSVTATLPISSTQGDTPVISIREASNAQSGAATASQITALEAASSAKHTQNTDTGTTAVSFILNSTSLTNKYTITTAGLAADKSNDAADIDSAITLKHSNSLDHNRSHALDGTSDHTIGGLTATYHVMSDGTKLAPSTNTDSQISAAVSASHNAVTVSAPISLSGQALSLKNNAGSPGTITDIDINVVDANSDVKIPTSKAVATAIAANKGTSFLLMQVFS